MLTERVQLQVPKNRCSRVNLCWVWKKKKDYCCKSSIYSLQSGRIGADEVIDDTDGKGAEEVEEKLKEKEAKTQAILLEMVRRGNLLWAFYKT